MNIEYKYLLYVLLAILLGFMIYNLSKNKALSRRQKGIKIFLNSLLFGVMALFVMQPKWSVENHSVLVFDDFIAKTSVNKFQDSLQVKKTLSYSNFKDKINEFSNSKIIFLGQQAEPSVIAHLVGSQLQWIPFFFPNVLQDIKYQAVVDFGEYQKITGKIFLSEPQELKISFENKTLDSTQLKKGFNNFELKFPAFSVGRNVVSLKLQDISLDSIRFFAKPQKPYRFLFLLDHPDFESRILAEELGKLGNEVEVITSVAKSSTFKTNVNTSGTQKAPDYIITTPSRASDTRIEKALNEGKSVLFMGLTSVENELGAINKKLSTRFSAKRISSDEEITSPDGIPTKPYVWNEFINQRVVESWPVAYQKNGGKVGVSLVNETFPLKLSGDSTTYRRFWQSIFAALTPSDSSKWQIDGPILNGLPTLLSRNSGLDLYKVNQDDSLFFQTNTVTGQKSGAFLFANTGWQTVGDSVEVFVEDMKSFQTQKMKSWTNQEIEKAERNIQDAIPIYPIYWFVFIVLVLTVIWVEAKFKY